MSDRLIAVNQALQLFVPGTFVQSRQGGGLIVTWTDWDVLLSNGRGDIAMDDNCKGVWL